MKRMRVLVVDDQPRARQSMHALLGTAEGVGDIQEVEGGAAAIAAVEAFRPDLILMDARMPEMDGLEATRLIKARWPNVRVILMSMYPDYREGAKAAGADAFLAKDEAPARLLDLIDSLAALQASPDELP